MLLCIYPIPLQLHYFCAPGLPQTTARPQCPSATTDRLKHQHPIRTSLCTVLVVVLVDVLTVHVRLRQTTAAAAVPLLLRLVLIIGSNRRSCTVYDVICMAKFEVEG